MGKLHHKKKEPGSKQLKKVRKDGGKNAKAFTYKSAIRAARATRRTADVQSKKLHLPSVDRSPLEPPPVCVAVVGPPKVGKSSLIAGLIKNFTRQSVSSITGPVTVVSGESCIQHRCSHLTGVVTLPRRKEAPSDSDRMWKRSQLHDRCG